MAREMIGRNLPRVKEVNQFLIREKIYRKGPVSRIEIAESLGLTLPTITTNVNRMLSRGLIREIPDTRTRSRLGRHTMLLDIVPESRLYLGIEIRRGFRRAVVVDMRGNVVSCASDSSRLNEYDDAIRNAAEITLGLFSAGKPRFDDIASVGICTPGLVDSEKGLLISLLGHVWNNREIGRDMAGLLGYKGDVVVANNVIARAFGLSLFRHEILKDTDNFAYMYVSTGIACPLLRDVREHFGMVVGEGEVGHMVMNPDGPACNCGNHGCLCVYSSEQNIMANSIRAMREGEAPVLAKIVGGDENRISMEVIIEALEQGDPAVTRLVDEAVRYLGLAIANIDNFVKPGCVTIECRYFNYDRYKEMLMAVINRNLYHRTGIESRFVFLPEDLYSGAKGAAAFAVKSDLESEMSWGG